MTLGQIRDIAVLILFLEIFVLALVPLALAYLAVRGLGRLLPRTPGWLRTARGWIAQVGTIVAMLMQWLLAPILLLSGLGAGLREGVAAFRRR